jgi:hypothetical protein
MSELSPTEYNNILNLQIDTIIKYKDESYKVINTNSSRYGYFIYIEKIPDDGKKYNLCLITKDNTLSFHILGFLNVTISYSDIEIL